MLKDYFGLNADCIREKRLFLLDMDGTIYNENTIFSGTLNFLDEITNLGGKYVFITNNSSKSVNKYIEKVTKMGIKADKTNFFTSTMAAVMVLKEKFGRDLIYAEGTSDFLDELKLGGLNITTDYDISAKAILLGYDTELTFEKVITTTKMLSTTNAEYYATHPDYVCPTSYGFVPDLGSYCFGLQKATGKTPIVIGKPKPTMLLTALKMFGQTKEKSVVIGDRLATDIASGFNAGIDTICVLSGEATVEDILASEVKPNFVFHSIENIKLI